MQNIMNNALSEAIGAWWRIADHTAGNETGRMMVVNGSRIPGAVFFRDTVTVQPNTNYLYRMDPESFKVTGYPNPELGVRILNPEGDVIQRHPGEPLIPVNTNAPEWKQIGMAL